MRANYVHLHDDLKKVLKSKIPGDVAEFGVWYGTTFIPMAEMCRQHRRTIHAVDSFIGMAPPTEMDGDEKFRTGNLSVGGSKLFRVLAKPFGHTIQIHEGFVPSILQEMRKVTFAFVHLDLDQYQPMLDSMSFVWPRLSKGGVIYCHDYFKDRNILAAQAIKNFCSSNNINFIAKPQSSHAVLWKL